MHGNARAKREKEKGPQGPRSFCEPRSMEQEGKSYQYRIYSAEY